MALSPTAQHVGGRDPQVVDHNFGVTRRSVHGGHLSHTVPSLTGDVHDESGVGRLRHFGIILGPSQQDGKRRPRCIGDEPFVSIHHPLIAVLICVRTDEGGIRAGHLRLRHGEAAHGPPIHQRAEILLLLLIRAPMQQRMHVSLIGCLTIEHPRPVTGTRRFGLHHGQFHMTEPHTAPLLGHMG